MYRRGMRDNQQYRALHCPFGGPLTGQCYRHSDEFGGSIQDVLSISDRYRFACYYREWRA
jgi:hypothetical protein